MKHSVSRKIGIDAGHRVMTHGSKCRHIHGHRYGIEVICSAQAGHLHESGEQTDMVVDFGFLKEEMERHIDAPCDHGFIASIQDQDVLKMFAPEDQEFEPWLEKIKAEVGEKGHCATTDCLMGTKLYVIRSQTTAECLARHWFNRLKEPVEKRSDGVAELTKVVVWETPNCWAEYGE